MLLVTDFLTNLKEVVVGVKSFLGCQWQTTIHLRQHFTHSDGQIQSMVYRSWVYIIFKPKEQKTDKVKLGSFMEGF